METTDNSVPCVTYGLGAFNIPTKGTCTMVSNKDECTTPQDIVGRGDDAYTNLNSCPEALKVHQSKIRTNQLTVALSFGNNQIIASLIKSVPNLSDTISELIINNTLLLPTDQAFNKLSPQLITFLKNSDNIDILTKILNYHLVKNTNDSSVLLPPTITIDNVLIPDDIQLSIPIYNNNNNNNNNNNVPFPNSNVVFITPTTTIPKWLNQKNPINNWS